MDTADQKIDLVLALHACGSLSDSVIETALRFSADLILVPCCYGQLQPLIQSNAWIPSAKSSIEPDHLSVLSSSADLTVSAKAVYSEQESQRLQCARKCMDVIDSLRALDMQCRDSRYICALSSLYPLHCSPKNNVFLATRFSHPFSSNSTHNRTAGTKFLTHYEAHLLQKFCVVLFKLSLSTNSNAEYYRQLPKPNCITIYAQPEPRYRQRIRVQVRRWWDESRKQNRAEFLMWDSGSACVSLTKKDGVPLACELAHQLMVTVWEIFEESGSQWDSVGAGIQSVQILCSMTGSCVLSLVYKGVWSEFDRVEWLKSAVRMRECIADRCAMKAERLHMIHKSRGCKLVLGNDWVDETLCIEDSCDNTKHCFQYVQPEGSFSNPNGKMNENTLQWLRSVVKMKICPSENGLNELIELYCGNGNHTVALSDLFERVIAVELDSKLVHAAKRNLLLNDIGNVHVLQCSAETFMNETKKKTHGLISNHHQRQVLLVDPPRSGLGDSWRIVRRFNHVLYISCSVSSLSRDLALLNDFEIGEMALLDQFAYTKHIECAVYLKKKTI
uniref:Methyltransferase domain-containing protein n=1 Tax=Timspurckia oligopyrenoides TaxID=708627 RepID=A0A7S0ZGV7_9RHOD